MAKPGGRVIVSTPNTINMSSRMRGLFDGSPSLFGLLPLSEHDARFLTRRTAVLCAFKPN